MVPVHVIVPSAMGHSITATHAANETAMAVCGAIAWFVSRDASRVAPAIALGALTLLTIALDVVVPRRAESGGILKP
jgi:hypothetical protein